MSVNLNGLIVEQWVNKLMGEEPRLFASDDEERRRYKCLLLLGEADYLGEDLTGALPCITTDGGSDGGFAVAYIEESQFNQVNVILFQSKYVRDLNKQRNFPGNAVAKAVQTVETFFDPQLDLCLNENSRRVVNEIHSLMLDGYIPYVMVSNTDTWNEERQRYLENAFGG